MATKITAQDGRGNVRGYLEDHRSYHSGGFSSFVNKGKVPSSDGVSPDYVPPLTVCCGAGCSSVVDNHKKFALKAQELGLLFIPVTHPEAIKV